MSRPAATAWSGSTFRTAPIPAASARVSNYDHVKNADKEGYIRSYVGATAYAGGICGIAMPDVRFTDCIADAAQTSASVDDPNDSESFPRRASTAAVSGGTPQIEGTQTVNGQGCNNVAVTIQNNAGEYLTGSSGANLEAAAGSPGAQQRYRLVTCSDGTFAIQSCVSLRYLSVGFPVLKVDGLKVSKNSSADFSSPAITGACEKFRFVKYNPDTGEYENASFQALPDSSAGFICFIRSENGRAACGGRHDGNLRHRRPQSRETLHGNRHRQL
jgi:hypothetical protein